MCAASVRIPTMEQVVPAAWQTASQSSPACELLASTKCEPPAPFLLSYSPSLLSYSPR